MTKIYITRHGQTEWNVEGRFQGHNNSSLTALGEKQAKWLGESLEVNDIDIIISSPTGRTMDTAKNIRGNRDVLILPDKDLIEIDLGDWEGERYLDVKEKWPVEYNNFWDAPHLYKSIGGEGFIDLVDRMGKVFERIISEYEGKSILIVTHAAALKALITYIEGKELKDLWNGAYMHPTCLNIIEVDKEGRRFTLQGDISHYKE